MPCSPTVELPLDGLLVTWGLCTQPRPIELELSLDVQRIATVCTNETPRCVDSPPLPSPPLSLVKQEPTMYFCSPEFLRLIILSCRRVVKL